MGYNNASAVGHQGESAESRDDSRAGSGAAAGPAAATSEKEGEGSRRDRTFEEVGDLLDHLEWVDMPPDQKGS